MFIKQFTLQKNLVENDSIYYLFFLNTFIIGWRLKIREVLFVQIAVCKWSVYNEGSHLKKRVKSNL